MNEEQLYARWKAQRRKVAVPEDFSARVMARLVHEAAARPRLSAAMHSRAAQIGLAFGLLLLGIFRLCFVTANLLVP